mgnify:CR=1 FL=1
MLVIAAMAIIVVVLLLIGYWFFIRTTTESPLPPTTDSKAVSIPAPTVKPTLAPATAIPPTVAPTAMPTAMPTAVPTAVPNLEPTPVPTPIPTALPAPTPVPTPAFPLPEIVNDNPPHVFVGTVTIGGQAAPEGTEVTAWVLKYSDPVGTSIVPSVANSPGSYSLLVPQYGSDFTGTVLMIKVNGGFVKNVIWKSGDGDLLDLTK